MFYVNQFLVFFDCFSKCGISCSKFSRDSISRVLRCPIDLCVCAEEVLSLLGDLRGQRSSPYTCMYIHISVSLQDSPAPFRTLQRAESQWNFFVEGAAMRKLRVFSEWNQSGIFKASLISPSLCGGKSSLGRLEVLERSCKPPFTGEGITVVGGVGCWCAR